MTTPAEPSGERLALRFGDGSMSILTGSDMAAARRERDVSDGSLDIDIVRVRVAVVELVEPWSGRLHPREQP